MQATRNQHDHQAIVLINYTPENFSIRYFASSNLNYTGPEIHKAYNQWVRELEEGIRAQSSI
jgi:hypothetical protein